MKQKRNVRIAMWISGITWVLSWIGIWLEIFYWHHMTPSLKLNPPPQLAGLPPPRPGNFLLAIILFSVIAPLIFLTLVLGTLVRKQRAF